MAESNIEHNGVNIFDKWGHYQSIIRHNHMYHKEIINALTPLIKPFKEPKIVDLGCGDAYIPSRIIEQNKRFSYIGLDASKAALHEAKKQLNQHTVSIHLINKDMQAGLTILTQPVDVVMAGYSIHHLKKSEKEHLFHLIAQVLKPGGFLIFYDLESRHNENYSAYNQRICRFIHDNWQALTEEGLSMTVDHVTNNDMAENANFHQTQFEKHFTNFKRHFRDTDQFFSLYTATR